MRACEVFEIEQDERPTGRYACGEAFNASRRWLRRVEREGRRVRRYTLDAAFDAIPEGTELWAFPNGGGWSLWAVVKPRRES